MKSAIELHLAEARRRFLLPWLAAVLCVLAIAGLGFALAASLGARPEHLPTLPKFMTVAGLSWCGLVLFVRQQILTPIGIAARMPAADAAAVVRHMLAGCLVLWVAAVAPAIIGIVQLFAGGDERMHLLLCAASLMILGYLLPTQAKLAALGEAVMQVLEKALGARGGGA